MYPKTKGEIVMCWRCEQERKAAAERAERERRAQADAQCRRHEDEQKRRYTKPSSWRGIEATHGDGGTWVRGSGEESTD